MQAKSAYLVYRPEEAVKNKEFIKMFQEKGKAEGFAFSCVTSEEYRKKPLPELVLNRTRQPEVSRWYEERGIFCLHCSTIVERANDKYLTLYYLQESLPNQILQQKWCPATMLFPAGESVTKVARAPAASLLASGHLSDGHHEYVAKRSANVSVRSTESHVFHEDVCAAGGDMLESDVPGIYRQVWQKDVQKIGRFTGNRDGQAVYRTIENMWKNGKTDIMPECGQAQEIRESVEAGRDLVIKSVHGHGGTEVFLAQEAEKHWDVLRGKDCIVQERIAGGNRDLRVYLLGGKIYQAVLRTGAEGDFRSNFSLGGSASIYRLSPGEREYIECFVQAVQEHWGEIGIAGMDFILDRDGRLIFNEMEDMVGCRMLYQCGGGDIVGDFVRCLRKRES